MIINNNIKSLNIQGQLSKNSALSAKSNEKLATGIRINSASDDAAGLCISEKMKMQIRGLQKASTNSQDGISMIQVADGAMGEIHSILKRAYELSIQAANDTNTIEDKNTLANEVNELVNEINSIYNDTKFNGIKVLEGSKNKIITKTETVIVKEMVDEVIFETKGELPSFVSSKGLTGGYLNSNIIMEETKYNRVSEKITYTDSSGNEIEVESFKSATGTTYKKGDLSELYSAGSSNEIRDGDDGIKYTIHYKYDEIKKDMEHPSDLIDFSSINASNIKDLVGTGFQTTCCSCSKRYSIKFIDDAESSYKLDGENRIYSINIKDVTSGVEITERIMQGLLKDSNTSTTNRTDSDGDNWEVYVPGNHFTGFAAEKDNSGNNTGKLLIYDFPNIAGRKPYPENDRGILKSGYYESTIIKVEKEIQKVISTEVEIAGKEIILQVGANKGDILKIDLPDMGLDMLKLDKKVSFETSEKASEILDTIQQSINYVSTERGRMGAYENRLEHIINNGTNAHYNLLSAQSRINDTDMAKEIMNSSKYNIMQQSMYALLSQSNDLPNKVLELLKI